MKPLKKLAFSGSALKRVGHYCPQVLAQSWSRYSPPTLIRTTAKERRSFRHQSPSIVPKRNVLAVDLTVSPAHRAEKSSTFSRLYVPATIEWEWAGRRLILAWPASAVILGFRAKVAIIYPIMKRDADVEGPLGSTLML